MSGGSTRRQFLAGASGMAGAALLRASLGEAALQDPVLNAGRNSGPSPSHERVRWAALPFPMKQVRLLPGPCLEAQEANRRYLHTLPVDRLAHTFRVTAGLPSSAEPLGGWEKPDSELRGHFAGGHYLSAVALLYASTGDEDLKKKGAALVSALAECRKQMKSGYLSAFPIELFDRLRERVKVWAPFYTIHKIMAGHLDMFVHTGNEQALQTAEKMAGWVDGWTTPLSYEHMQRVLGTEFGGMAEVLCNLYAVTGKRQYLDVARRFDHAQFEDPLAAHRDELKGLHVNTQIPKVIGAARRYELTGETRYRDIAQYFWDEVTSERCYCTGGTSNDEHWNTGPGKLSQELGTDTTEDCCAYNMMKLTRHLFGWSPSAHTMDYYERTLWNHRLGTINPEDGTTMYYLPLASGYWKVFGKPFDAFWCCTGTGAEEFAKLTDTIYFHDDRSIYVNLFVASELHWPEKKIRLRQETQFPRQAETKLTILAEQPSEFDLHLRIPYWAQGGAVKINGRVLPVFASRSSYLTLRGPWKNGDVIELSLPMGLHRHPMPDDESLQAVMYGPLVLAGRFDAVTPEMQYEGYGPRGTPFKAPEIAARIDDVASWVKPVSGQPLLFRAGTPEQAVDLVPLNQILHNRYAVYWKVRPPKV
ncbi:MAG: glycoside hydrolase family 127 protein [Acidobacteriia bacterium]|nr:glycoside hydrolase family 127 protein [Terriglobia bacterium]